MLNHRKSFPYNNCLAYRLFPIFRAFRIHGLQFQKSCPCIKERNNFVHNIFVIQTHWLEIVLWLTVILIFLLSYWRLSCGKAINLFGNFKNYANFTLSFVSLYNALQYSILKRKRISFHYEMNIYKGEKKFVDKTEKILLAILSLFFFTLIVISITTTFVYSYLKFEKCSDLEALFCTVLIQMYLFNIESNIFSLITFITVIYLVIGKRFIELSKQLQVERKKKVEFLQDLIKKHLEMREFFEEFNEQWKVLIPLVYFHFLYLAGFLLYGAIFINTNSMIRYTIAILAVILFCGCLAIARILSILTSLIYDNFIAIGICALLPLPIKFKFKIIDFMKRFGGMPMGISVAGFFFVKKNFFIRVVSGLYSVFSTILDLTGVMEKKKCVSTTHNKFNESMYK